MVFANEKCWRSEEQIHEQISKIWKVMQSCMQRGFENEGELPGGLMCNGASATAQADGENQVR